MLVIGAIEWELTFHIRHGSDIGLHAHLASRTSRPSRAGREGPGRIGASTDAGFADPRAIESTRSAYEEHQKRQRVAYAMPWSSAVLHALEHSPVSRVAGARHVFPIGHADLARLRQLHLDYYQRVRHLVAKASGADHGVVMNVQLCVLDEARPSS